MTRYYVFLLTLFIVIGCAGGTKPDSNTSIVAGKWKSSSKTVIYISDEKAGLKIQFIIPDGRTFTKFAKWLEKNKKFSYYNNTNKVICTVETKNLIISESNDIKVWRRIE